MSAGSAKPLYLDLSEARRAALYQVSGRYIKVIEASSTNAVATMGFDTQVSDANLFTLKKGLEARGKFERLYINNDAQVGEWMRILVTDGGEDDLQLDYANETNVDGNVDIGVMPAVTVAANQKVTVDGGATLSTGQVSVTTSSTLVIAANANRKSVTFRNNNTTTAMYIGNTGVLTSTGHTVGAGESYSTESRAAIYAVSSSGTCVVTYMEESV